MTETTTHQDVGRQRPPLTLYMLLTSISMWLWIRFPAGAAVLVAVGAFHADVYARRIGKIQGGSDRRRRFRRDAHLTFRRIRTVGVALAVVTVVVGLFLPRPVLGLVLGADLAAYLCWLATMPRLNKLVSDAGVPRLAGEGSGIRHALETLELDRRCLRPVGEHRLPGVHGVVTAGLVLATLVAFGGESAARAAAAQNVPATVITLLGLIPPQETSHSTRPERTPEAPREDDTAVTAAQTPSALPASPCPSVRDVARTLAQGVPESVGSALYSAWYAVGGAVIGCPSQPPVRLGRLWIVELSGGQDTPAQLAYGAGSAHVVYSDLYVVISGELPGLASVDARLRWGFGTQQLLHSPNGSCELVQRYGQATPALLPAAVTSLVLDMADKTGAVPRLTASPITSTGRRYDFALLAADSSGQVRTIDSVSVVYRAGGAVSSIGTRAVDGRSCPVSQLRLPVVSDALEAAVQGHD